MGDIHSLNLPWYTLIANCFGIWFSSVATLLLPMNVLPNSTARRVLMYVIYTAPLFLFFFSSPAGGIRSHDSTNNTPSTVE